MFAGQLACEAVNFALKRLIKEERPARIHKTGKGYGMPSSHAQFAFFWAVALGLFLLARHRPIPKAKGRLAAAPTTAGDGQNGGLQGGDSRVSQITYYYRYYKDTPAPLTAITADIERFAHDPWSFAQRSLASFCALVLAGLVAWSRVYLGYHTPQQVLAGCLAGAVCAVGWFGITYVARQTGLLSFLLDLSVARWFRLRDLVVEEDLCQAGWEKWEARKQQLSGQGDGTDDKGQKGVGNSKSGKTKKKTT